MPKDKNEIIGNKAKNTEVNKKATQQKAQPQKRRKMNLDNRAYKPRRTKKVDTQAFTTESLLKLMGSASSPAKKAVLINTTNTRVHFDNNVIFTPTKKHSTQVLSPTKVKLSTPEKGPLTSFVTTPMGSKLKPSRIIECDDGAYTLFISEDKVEESELKIPTSVNKWVLKSSPIPKDSLDGFEDYKITRQGIFDTEKLIKKRKERRENPRLKSQNDLMKYPANKSLRKAGFEVEDNTAHWLDFLPHNFVGDASRTPKNLGIGTRFANAAMELVNRAIRQLLCEKDSSFTSIYLTVKPEWVPGYENIRLLKSLKVIIKDSKAKDAHQACFKFNCLTLEKVCITDVNPIKQFILKKFQDKTKAANKQIAIPVAPLADKSVLGSIELNTIDDVENDGFKLHRAPVTFAFDKHSSHRRPFSPVKLKSNTQKTKTGAKRSLSY